MFGWMLKIRARQQIRPFAVDVNEASFRAELATFCDAVRRDIADIDDATQWTEALFEPLEAEVEVQRSDGPQRQVRDLMVAIRNDTASHTFLVLGEPGSGKSVALRKLTLDLLNEVPRSGRLPLYINLKECRVVLSVSTAASISLYGFVIAYLRDRYNVVAAQFIDRYFDRLYRTGHLFFVLDSFDEIPAILDATDHSDRLRDISRAVFELIQAPGQTQGVIASRYYKKPMLVGQTVTTLEVRPFTETKIRAALERTRRFPSEMLQTLFAERPDLVSIAQNPFSATMLARYVSDRLALPARQSDLFAATISDRLDLASDWLSRASLARTDLETGATAIAVTMFASRDIGLDATIAELSSADVPGGSVERITEALAFARIGRFSPGPERRFSFVHRRFNEYFLVQKLLKSPSFASLQAIPTDNRWRDTLTLYCEVASEAEAVRIANFCWRHVSRLTDAETLTDEERFAAVQCLRFLRDAFTNRLTAIGDIRDRLTATIVGILRRELEEKTASGHFDVILVKLVVEAVGLLPQQDIERALQVALEIDHGWISQTALRSCRSLRKIEGDIEVGLARTLVIIPADELTRRYQELLFSLSVSEAFHRLRALLTDRHRGVQRLRKALPLLVILAPVVTVFAWLCAVWCNLPRPPARIRTARSAPQPAWLLDEQVPFRGTFLFVLAFPMLMVLTTYAGLIINGLLGHAKPIYDILAGFCGAVTSARLAALIGILPRYIDGTVFGRRLELNVSFCAWTAVAVIAVSAVVPWYVLRHSHLVAPGGNRRRWVRGGLTLAGGFVVLAALSPVVGRPLDWLVRHAGFVVWVFSAAEAIFILVLLYYIILRFWTAVRAYWRDRSRYARSSLVTDQIARETIARELAEYGTQRYRLRYVRQLIAHHPVVRGAWPGGVFPGSSNDAASIMLAQWEERLQRLD